METVKNIIILNIVNVQKDKIQSYSFIRAIHKDYLKVIHKFVSYKSLSFHTYRKAWVECGMSVIHHLCPYYGNEETFLQLIFSGLVHLFYSYDQAFLDSFDSNLSQTNVVNLFNLGVLYSLYTTYFTQKFSPKVKIRINTRDFLLLTLAIDSLNYMNDLDDCQIYTCWNRLITEKVFYFCTYSYPRSLFYSKLSSQYEQQLINGTRISDICDNINNNNNHTNSDNLFITISHNNQNNMNHIDSSNIDSSHDNNTTITDVTSTSIIPTNVSYVSHDEYNTLIESLYDFIYPHLPYLIEHCIEFDLLPTTMRVKLVASYLKKYTTISISSLVMPIHNVTQSLSSSYDTNNTTTSTTTTTNNNNDNNSSSNIVNSSNMIASVPASSSSSTMSNDNKSQAYLTSILSKLLPQHDKNKSNNNTNTTRSNNNTNSRSGTSSSSSSNLRSSNNTTNIRYKNEEYAHIYPFHMYFPYEWVHYLQGYKESTTKSFECLTNLFQYYYDIPAYKQPLSTTALMSHPIDRSQQNTIDTNDHLATTTTTTTNNNNNNNNNNSDYNCNNNETSNIINPSISSDYNDNNISTQLVSVHVDSNNNIDNDDHLTPYISTHTQTNILQYYYQQLLYLQERRNTTVSYTPIIYTDKDILKYIQYTTYNLFDTTTSQSKDISVITNMAESTSAESLPTSSSSSNRSETTQICDTYIERYKRLETIYTMKDYIQYLFQHDYESFIHRMSASTQSDHVSNGSNSSNSNNIHNSQVNGESNIIPHSVSRREVGEVHTDTQISSPSAETTLNLSQDHVSTVRIEATTSNDNSMIDNIQNDKNTNVMLEIQEIREQQIRMKQEYIEKRKIRHTKQSLKFMKKLTKVTNKINRLSTNSNNTTAISTTTDSNISKNKKKKSIEDHDNIEISCDSNINQISGTSIRRTRNRDDNNNITNTSISTSTSKNGVKSNTIRNIEEKNNEEEEGGVHRKDMYGDDDGDDGDGDDYMNQMYDHTMNDFYHDTTTTTTATTTTTNGDTSVANKDKSSLYRYDTHLVPSTRKSISSSSTSSISGQRKNSSINRRSSSVYRNNLYTGQSLSTHAKAHVGSKTSSTTLSTRDRNNQTMSSVGKTNEDTFMSTASRSVASNTTANTISMTNDTSIPSTESNTTDVISVDLSFLDQFMTPTTTATTTITTSVLTTTNSTADNINDMNMNNENVLNSDCNMHTVTKIPTRKTNQKQVRFQSVDNNAISTTTATTTSSVSRTTSTSRHSKKTSVSKATSSSRKTVVTNVSRASSRSHLGTSPNSNPNIVLQDRQLSQTNDTRSDSNDTSNDNRSDNQRNVIDAMNAIEFLYTSQQSPQQQQRRRSTSSSRKTISPSNSTKKKATKTTASKSLVKLSKSSTMSTLTTTSNDNDHLRGMTINTDNNFSDNSVIDTMEIQDPRSILNQLEAFTEQILSQDDIQIYSSLTLNTNKSSANAHNNTVNNMTAYHRNDEMSTPIAITSIPTPSTRTTRTTTSSKPNTNKRKAISTLSTDDPISSSLSLPSSSLLSTSTSMNKRKKSKEGNTTNIRYITTTTTNNNNNIKSRDVSTNLMTSMNHLYDIPTLIHPIPLIERPSLSSSSIAVAAATTTTTTIIQPNTTTTTLNTILSDKDTADRDVALESSMISSRVSNHVLDALLNIEQLSNQLLF